VINSVRSGRRLGQSLTIFSGLLLASSISFAQPTPISTPLGTPAPTPLTTATPTPPIPGAKTPTLSAEAYRANLQRELNRIKALQNRRPRNIAPILKRLDSSIIVRRADGQTQQVSGNAFSNYGRDISKPANAQRGEVVKLREIAEAELRALDEWLARPTYQPVDAKKIVGNLESTGQIRTGPLWWQKAIADAWKAIATAFKNFMDWINSLLPKPKAPTVTAAPSDKWLWVLFYGLVAAILAAIIWFAWKAFGGAQWGRRTTKRDAILEGEDALLLSLPPEELRSRADIYASQGNFREALRHRYLALLLQLDARGVWRYDARRTNWEHIAALRRRDTSGTLVTPLSALTRRFDRVRYGGAPCDDDHWRQFDADARDFETQAFSPDRRAEVTR
jgi:hypothetical protein